MVPFSTSRPGARALHRHAARRAAAASLAALATAAASAAALATVPVAAHAAAKPNLVVTAVSEAPTALAAGTRFTAADTVRNAGRGAGARSTVRFYLTADPERSQRERKASRDDPRASLTDILLSGAREVGPLSASATAPARRGTPLEVPAGTPAGRYRLMACADDRGAVAERREHDNCAVGKRPAVVADAAAAPTEIRSLRSIVRPLDAEFEAQLPIMVRQEWCAPVKYRSLSLDAAVKGAERHLRRTAGADALSAFRRSPAARSASAAEQAAAGAVNAGQPGAALAALLRAHALQPREASHLINAAAMATSVGLPNEALGMLAQAARLDDPDRAPMGISRQATLLAGRAEALVRVGKYGHAAQAAAAASALAPQLSEPHATQAAADLCEGRSMLPAYRKSRTREPEHPPQTPPHPIAPGSPWVDDSTGVPGRFRDLYLPGTPKDAPGLVGIYKAKTDAEVDWLMARNQREAELRTAMGASADPDASKDLRGELLAVVHDIHEAPDLKAIDRRFHAELDAARAERELMFGSGDDPGRYGPIQQDAFDACENAKDWEPCVTSAARAKCLPVAGGSHQIWLNHMSAALGAARDYQAEYGRRVSGTAAHISNNAAYELGLLAIPDREHGMRALLLQEASSWTGMLHGIRDSRDVHRCVATPEPPPPAAAAPDAPAAADGPGPCSGAVKDMNFVIPLPGSTVKLSCEAVAVEVATEGWIGMFAEVKYDFRGNRITVFGGAKAEVGFGPFKSDFKSGIYTTIGPEGLVDAGLRVGPSRTVTTGIVEWNPSDTIDMSLMPSRTAE